jgi:hypothetical protein
VVVGVYAAADLEIYAGLPTEVFKFLILPAVVLNSGALLIGSPPTTQGRFHG